MHAPLPWWQAGAWALLTAWRRVRLRVKPRLAAELRSLAAWLDPEPPMIPWPDAVEDAEAAARYRAARDERLWTR